VNNRDIGGNLLNLWQTRVRAVVAATAAIGIITTTVAGAQPGGRPSREATPSASIMTITGAQLQVAGSSLVVTRPGVSPGFLQLTEGRQHYLVPTAALPYLGQGLDLSLFRLSSLAAAERSGRLPLTITYSGRVPSLPGVRITTTGAGRASGYLTLASAVQFGTALTRRLLARDVRVSLAGAVAASRPVAATHALTITGTNLQGKPDTGDQVFVGDVSNGNAFSTLATFHNGIAKLSVPPGTFWAVGLFTDPNRDNRMVVMPQFNVSGNTAISVDERKATSKLSIGTPRPSTFGVGALEAYRTPAKGAPQLTGWLDFLGTAEYSNTTTVKPTVGKLGVFANATMSPPTGSDYVYELGFSDLSGLVHSPHYTVRASSLATVHTRLFASTPGSGSVISGADFVGFGNHIQTVWNWLNLPAPNTATLYLTASPVMAWGTEYQQSSVEYGDGSPTQSGAATLYRPGSTVTEDWNAYPLHPAPNVNLVGAAAGYSQVVSASRSGNLLSLDYWPFSDSVPGHTGTGFEPISPSVNGTYRITVNGKSIASGSALPLPNPTEWSFARQATLPAAPATIGLTLTAIRSDKIYTLSTESATTWTWRSSHAGPHTIAPYWTCSQSGGHDCVAQPLLTLGYSVAGLGLSGRTAPGEQTLGLTVGHLQLAAASAIKAATVQVSFNDGKTWHAASVTGRDGSYRAVYSAPAGAFVTLRVAASDTAGGSIAETITRAYAITDPS
jgi:hypothetical protein